METVDDAWCGRIRQGGSIVDDDDDNVDAVDIDRVLGFPPVETADDAWYGGGGIDRLLLCSRRR